jgi:hypothetical protein
MSSSSELLDPYVGEAWDEIFNNMPYTTFCMINYLLKKSNKDHEAFLVDPRILNKEVVDKITKDPANDFEDLMVLPGRCTSFSIQVVKSMEQSSQFPDSFDFQFYNFDSHRTAWCCKTKMLLDSTGLCGVMYMAEGDWLQFGSEKRFLKAINGVSKFRREGKPVSRAMLSHV